MQQEEEIRWLNRKIDDFEAAVRGGAWQLGQLEEQRAELRNVWNDSCSRMIAQRFFDPHAEEASREVADLKHGESQLRNLSGSIQKAVSELDTANHLSRDFQNQVAEASTIFHTIDSLISETMDRIGESENRRMQAVQLIENANVAGNAAASE